MSHFHVQIAEFSMEGGKRQERGYNVRIVSPASDTPDAAKGTLVMLLDLTGPLRHRRRYLRQLMNTIQSTYYASTGTPTSLCAPFPIPHPKKYWKNWPTRFRCRMYRPLRSS